ncbi:MAG: ThiF family adenylyltransferase [Bordetella sp.]
MPWLFLCLAAAGRGRLRLIDPDQVEIYNLPCQILFGSHKTGQNKAQTAAERLLYSSPKIKALDLSVGPEIAASLLSGSTVVIDCTDRFAARHLVNTVCLFPKGEAQPVAADAACSAQGSSQPPLNLSALASQRGA